MSEVKRILQIMGYEIGKPINEQRKIILESYIRTFTDELADLLINISSKTNGVIRNLTSNGDELGSLSKFQDLKDKLNSWSKTQGKSFDEQIDILNREIDNAGAGMGRLTDNEAKVWDNLLNDSWASIIKHIDDIEEITSRLNWWSLVKEQASDALRVIRQIDTTDIKAFLPDEIKQLKDEISDLIKYFDSYNVTYPYGKFKSDMIDELTRVRNSLSPKDNFVKKGFKEVIKNFWESIAVKRKNNPEIDTFISDLIRYWDQWTKSRDTKILELQKLQKELLELSEKGEYSESKMIRYQELLFSTREEFTSSVKSYLNSPEAKKFISDDMRKLLENDERYLRWIEQADSNTGAVPFLTAAEKEALAWIKTLNTFILPNFIYTLFSKYKNKDVSYGKLFWNNWREGTMRLITAGLTTSPRFPSEVLSLKNKLGSGGWALAGSLVVHHALSNFVVPYYIAFFQVTWNLLLEPAEAVTGVNLHTWGLEDDPEASKFIGEGGDWKYMDYLVYKFNVAAYGSDFADQFKDFGVEDLLTTKEKSWFENIFLKWTYADELFRKFVKFGTGGGSNQQVRQESEQLRQDARDGVENVIDAADSLGNNLQQETDTLYNEVRDEIEDVISPDEGDTENGPVVIGPNDGRGDVIENYNNTNPNDKVTNYNRNTGEATYKGKKGKITRGGNGDLVFMSDDYQTVKNFGQ